MYCLQTLNILEACLAYSCCCACRLFAIASIISCLDWNTSVETTSKINILQKFKIVSPIFGPYLANSELVCKYLFQSIVNKNSNIHLALSSTVMIIGTTRDPATPYEWAVALSKSFPNSFLVTLDADGHTGQGRSNSCIDGAVNAYLIDFHGSSRAITCASFGQ